MPDNKKLSGRLSYIRSMSPLLTNQNIIFHELNELNELNASQSLELIKYGRTKRSICTRIRINGIAHDLKFLQKVVLTKESPINAFNGLDSLKWIRFDELKNIDNLTEHKFCSAKWMIGDQTQHKRGIKVVLINLDYSHENIKKIYLECHDQLNIHDILGITQDPQDEYASHGNLRNYLNHNLGKLSMFCKIDILLSITMGLKAIHSAGLVHGDLHSGNVLCDKFNGTNITDLEVPDLFKQLIIRCWDSLPANRPNADELFTTIYNWWKQKDNKDSELYKQIQKSKDFPKKNPRVFSSHRTTSRIYSTAYYTNRPLNISTFPKHLSSDFNIRSISIPNQSKYVATRFDITLCMLVSLNINYS
ncbi:1512_t:CDS:2 [Gigaspora margarita]|uniref:1512_t:CDS:1 n=1 Tax=Gigaspora margarita TaxID=4874 RepID=A0ABN7UJ70_GIGMA|nr:1512_t:CDS:2 [Gigaspora margarita]